MSNDKTVRVNLNVPRKLLNDFDKIVKARHTNRTELIKSLMLQAIKNDIEAILNDIEITFNE